MIRPTGLVVPITLLLACGDPSAADATTDAPPTLDPDAPGATCPGTLDPSHVHAQAARPGVSATMFVDLDDPANDCANNGPAAMVASGRDPSFTIDPTDGVLYYLEREEQLDSPTSVMRVNFDALVWSTEFSSGHWVPPMEPDEVVATFDGPTCGGALLPRLVFHGPTEQIGVLCDGVAPGLALFAFDGLILAQWSVESYVPRQFAADGRVVFESTGGDVFVAEAGTLENPSRVGWPDDEAPLARDVRILGNDVRAAGVGLQGEVRRYRREGEYFELDAELGQIGIGALDDANAPAVAVMLEADGGVVTHASILLPGDKNEYDVRALVQRFSTAGAEVLFDTLVDPDVGLDDSEGVDPEVTVFDVFIAG